MAGPWEKYQAASTDGPWSKYQATPQAKPQPSALQRAGSAFVQNTPVGVAMSAWNDPIGTVVGMAKSLSGGTGKERAMQQLQRGNYSAAARDLAMSMMPGTSMISDVIASTDANQSGTIDAEDLPEIIGTAAGTGLTAFLPKAPRAAKNAASAVASAPGKAVRGAVGFMFPGAGRLMAVAEKLGAMFGEEIPPPPPKSNIPRAPVPDATTPPPRPVNIESTTQGASARRPVPQAQDGVAPSGTVSMMLEDLRRRNPRIAAEVESKIAPQVEAIAAEVATPAPAPKAKPTRTRKPTTAAAPMPEVPPEVMAQLETLPESARGPALELYRSQMTPELRAAQPEITMGQSGQGYLTKGADYESAARAVKADQWAEVLHSNGITSADIAMMTPELWQATSRGLGFRVPSKKTQAQIMTEVARRESMFKKKETVQ